VPIESPAEAEFRFSPEDFDAIAAMLRGDAGITLPAGKAALVYARLAKRLRALDLANFGDYVALLASPAGEHERRNMVSALTTNVTRFFREPHHFEHLRTAVLPPLLAWARRGGRVRLWSAGCSSGEEAYSLAAVVAALAPEAASLDVRILATDIDQVVLERTLAARYATIEGVPPDLRRWFEHSSGGWKVAPALKSLLRIKQLNLTRPWPLRGPFDAVLCRNVAIYFDIGMQHQLWDGFADVIGPGGMLYIGHSERLAGRAGAKFENIGITAYRRRKALS